MMTVSLFVPVIEEELDFNDRAALDDINLLTPEEMKAFWTDMFGRDGAKSSFCLGYNRGDTAKNRIVVELQKEYVLMPDQQRDVGERYGTNAGVLNVHFTIADISVQTKKRDVAGRDVEKAFFLKVIQAADRDIKELTEFHRIFH